MPGSQPRSIKRGSGMEPWRWLSLPSPAGANMQSGLGTGSLSRSNDHQEPSSCKTHQGSVINPPALVGFIAGRFCGPSPWPWPGPGHWGQGLSSSGHTLVPKEPRKLMTVVTCLKGRKDVIGFIVAASYSWFGKKKKKRLKLFVWFF